MAAYLLKFSNGSFYDFGNRIEHLDSFPVLVNIAKKSSGNILTAPKDLTLNDFKLTVTNIKELDLTLSRLELNIIYRTAQLLGNEDLAERARLASAGTSRSRQYTHDKSGRRI